MSVKRSNIWWNSIEGPERPQKAFSPIDERAARMHYAEWRERTGLPKISRGILFATSPDELKRLMSLSLQPSLFSKKEMLPITDFTKKRVR